MGQVKVKFAADQMLGRLAKWLRVIGQDVIYGPHLSGRGLVRAARAENRIILTRDRRLQQMQPPPFILIQSDDYREQLRQVVAECGIDARQGLFTRCIECNAVLQSLAKDKAEGAVPPYVFATQEKFSSCPTCRRIYWPATHQRNMFNELRSMGLC